jgi:hypothetical protein
MANINLYRVAVPAGSYSKVDWIECEGYYGPTQYLQNGLLSIDFQAQNNMVSASSAATISIIGYCNDDCTGCYLIGETTTTSTTIPPINFTLTPSCEGSGINGTGKIVVNGFSGGNGTYSSVAIGNSAGSALSATPISLGGASTYSFTGVFNGTWFIILRDSSGASTTKSTAVNCTNTTTTTSTSTTSTTSTSTSTSTTSTTTASPAVFSLGYGSVNFFVACTTTRTNHYAANGSSLGINTILYNNSTLTAITADGYYSDGTNWWRITAGDGKITSTGSCSTTTTTSTSTTSTTSTSTTAAPTTTTTSTSTTTTVAPISFILTYDASVGGQACANFANNVGKTTYYTPGITPLADGVGLFTDSNCTTFVNDGYYSDGTNWWYVSGGTLSTQTTCSIEWYTLTKCFGSGTTTTKAYPFDTFNVNDRVHIGTAPNQTYYTITTVHTSDPGGSHTSPISDSTTSCPSVVDYTISADCPYPLGKITVNGLSGGLGTYQITTNLYSTSVAALAATTWESITTSKDYTSVSDGTYYVAVRDAGNIENIIAKSVVVACTTTTTTSTSTSTTSTSTSTSTTTAAPTTTSTSTSSTTSTTTQPGDTTTTTTSTTEPPTTTTTTTTEPPTTTTTTTTAAPTTTSTSTSTSTSTTTAAPTTTSTSTTTAGAPPTSANIYINNQMFNGDITDVTVNGVSISGVSFPISIGSGGTGTTSYIGTYDIQVYYNGVTPLNSHIDCIDSNATDTCANIYGGGSQVFTNQVIDGITDINIIANDSSC